MGSIYMTEEEHSNRWEGHLNKAAQRELLIYFDGNMMLSWDETLKKGPPLFLVQHHSAKN